MYKEQKKNAPEAATSETKNSNKNITDKSIPQNDGKIKIVVQNPGEISTIAGVDNTIEAIQLSKSIRKSLSLIAIVGMESSKRLIFGVMVTVVMSLKSLTISKNVLLFFKLVTANISMILT